MEEQIQELFKAANLLRTVSVSGEHWLSMQAVYNSLLKVANELKGCEVKQDESSDNDT